LYTGDREGYVMDQEKQIEEISELEEIKHMIIEMMKTQDMILEKLERIAHRIDKLKLPVSKEKI
jgi:hypothetical protein